MTPVSALLEAGIVSLPVDTAKIAKHYSIKLADYRSVTEIYDIGMEELYRHASTQGFSFMEDGQYICAINENACGKARRRWTIAHELGHILMGHVDNISTGSLTCITDPELERAADRFAAGLLAPLSVLHFCKVSSVVETAWLCGLSKQAAEYRYRELDKLHRQQSEFLPSDNEQELLQKFQPFIAEYLAEKSRHSNYDDYLKRKLRNPMHIE